MTPHALAEAIGWTVAHAAWQAAAVAAVLAACLRILPRAASRARYASACAGMLVVILLPLATAALALVRPETAGAAADPSASAFVSAPSILAADVLAWIGWTWLAGVALSVARLMIGWRQTRRLRMDDVHPAPAEWEARMRILTRRTGVRDVPLRVSGRVDVPMVAGIRRPMVLLPRAVAEGLGAAQADAVLAHELAHVRRRDPLANLAQLAVEALLWFHPGVRWMSARARREREHCCDATVVALGGDAVGYARALAALEHLRAPRRLALAATDGELLDRIRRLVSPRVEAAGTARTTNAAALAVVSVLCLALGARAAAAATRGLLPSPAPARMDVRAFDPAGEFTLAVERGRVVAATVAGVPVARERLIQRRDSVYLLSERGDAPLAIQLRADGIRWYPRDTSR
ncbi:MAG TPA: M56 family metallopeptidase [Longimicrobium sp.]|nr:M56 family metallopeptidase [Longimicrobium sp.]